jgi:hypothetical protein
MRMRNTLWALSVGALLAVPAVAQASSHREAPFVTKNPKVDGTDFYMFDSYGGGAEDGMVTFIANYLPLQDANGGPNYFTMDDQALYEIMIDNTGDCVEDLTFQFQFTNALNNGGAGLSVAIGDGGNIPVPLINLGAPNTTTGNYPTATLNVEETYTVGVVAGPRRGSAAMAVTNMNGGGMTFTKPTDNIGTKTFGANPNDNSKYAAYANQYVYDITVPNCAMPGKLFVGQRGEPFAVNLGPTFDLINAPGSVVGNGGVAVGGYQTVPNPLTKKNVTSIELELPATCVAGASGIVAGWTSASVRQARVINPKATYGSPSKEGGAWTQVSRLSAPLVNEVVIGLPDKDLWNSSYPTDDATNFLKYVEYPTLPALIDVVLGVGFQPQTFPRTDLVAAFLTGLPGANAFPATDAGPQPAACEMMRLNTGVNQAITTKWATPVGSQNRLGAAGCAYQGTLTPTAATCDLSGFPNGRRPIDDVVDVALDAMEGYLLPAAANAPAYSGAHVAPNEVLFTDGVDQACTTAGANCDPVQFLPTFPYLPVPNQGAHGDGS